MINVAYDHQVFAFQQFGGVSRYFYELAKRVNSAPGFSASVVAPFHVNRYLSEGGAAVRGLRIPAIPKASRIVSLANHWVSSALFKTSPPDVLHETYYSKVSLAPNGCPVVLTVYDMIHEKLSHARGKFSSRSAAKMAAVMRADRVICISENTRMDLIKHFKIDPAKLRTIHLGFSLTRTVDPPVPPTLPKPFFLYVGQRAGYKNFSKLLDAYASSDHVRKNFDLIAFGVNTFTRQEQKSVNAHGLDSTQVRQLSGDDSLLGYLYRNATALVYPSLYEGFGIPPLEAMSFNCPVLCSNCSSIPEIVGDAGLYFDPNSSESIREALEGVASSTDLRLDLIARGNRRVLAFSYDRCALETMNVYREASQS